MSIRILSHLSELTQLYSDTLYRSTRIRHACRSNVDGTAAATAELFGRVYVQSRYCFATRRPRRGSKQYLSHAPASLRRFPRGRLTPADSLLQKPVGERGALRERGEAFSVRPSRLDSSRVTASSAVSQAPSGSIRLPPLRPQLPPPSTAKSNAPTAPAPAQSCPSPARPPRRSLTSSA